MKKLVILFLLLCSELLPAQVQLPFYPDSAFSTYYHQRRTQFQLLPFTNGDIVFIGNSITDGGEWSELFGDKKIKNRGISGDVTAGVINRIQEIVDRKPVKVFLMIGVNDLARGVSPDSVIKNILTIADFIKYKSPSTSLFVQSILPVNDVFGKFGGHVNKGQQIREANEKLFASSEKHHYIFLDVHKYFCNAEGKMNVKFSNDGLHLTGEGYLLWKHFVFPYVYDLQEKPSLLPLPQRIKWNQGYFPIYNCRSVVASQKELEKEALLLKEALASYGWSPEIVNKAKDSEKYIELRLSELDSVNNDEEAYALNVSESKILITANTTHGIFNGIQTLKQLMRDKMLVDACEIKDWPAFAWRGYMIDVGRNYMSVSSLKQQIEVMSQYKLNVFHFHATEDIAWRIAINQYPQLTAPENMLRNKGQFYTAAEIKELIAFCKERHILFIPEIDMPGHSAAFKRAMKTDMQSDTGLQYVKNILKEFCETFDVSYLHIGADEVKIINRNFIPEVTKYIEGLGKKVIGWQPGGNFSDNTIRQLWMDDNGHLSSVAKTKYIDSRHLYLNHMDPLESVVTIFNRKILNKEKGDSSMLGGTLCMWNDRSVAEGGDILRMNPVYPGMLAFSERSWVGGGKDGWIANITDGDEKAFAEFEMRLLDHKNLYFKEKPFTYAKQSDLKWTLHGPFDNGGDASKKFLPETDSWSAQTSLLGKQVGGGTVVLRHWWAPLIKGAIDEPRENTTWYATTSIWSDETVERDCWIGFGNLSRSQATDSPPEGAWDNKGSAIWMNGKLIYPPKWKRAGQTGNLEIPLIDEGYEYREPAKVLFQKGWNTILVKTPVKNFKGKDWNNPVKWMFTFVIADGE